MTITKKFGLAVKAKRKKRKMTQQQLADASGIARSYISSIESGAFDGIQNKTAEKIADALNCEIDVLLRG